MDPRRYGCGSTRTTTTAAGRPSLLVIGLGPTGVEVALALAESNRCCLSLGDDALASASWIQSASCLLNGIVASAANAGVGKTMKRSQFLSAMLTSAGAQSVRTLSPVGDASTVERFDVVVMTDPTLPHAMAFNEHARAVGCGFILTEARGAVGRLFRDLGGSGDNEYSSRSLRGCLLDPWFVSHNPSPNSDHNGGVEAASRNPTPPVLRNARRGSESTSPRRFRGNSVNGRESASAGLLASSEYVRQQVNDEGQEAAAVPTAGRRAQFHVCFQALHMFWQEHGHLPVVVDRDQADEVVRIADEAMETGRNVPKGFSSQPETVDATLCRKVATTSRIPVPAVSFQLGGLVAAAVFDYVESHRFVNLEARDCALNKEAECRRKQDAEQQWLFVDELDAGLSESASGRTGAWKDERCDERVAVDPPPLEAWLGTDLFDSLAGARVAVIGCGRLGRDFVRCLLLTGVCTGPRGRMVFIDHGDAAPRFPSPSSKTQRCQADGNVVRGRAAVLRDAVSRHAGPDGSHVSAFDGAVQDTDTEMDLWQGVDAVVMCVGRGAGGVGAKRTGGAARGGCEDLVRFVSHKCVLHGKPLVWGWAGGAGEGGAGVEVMGPGRTSCLVCSSHGGLKQIIERRNIIHAETATPLDDRAPSPRPRQAPFSTPESGQGHCPVDEAWDPNGRCFGVARSAAAGVMAAELVKALKPRCRRQEFRNWRLKEVNRDSGRRRSKDGSTCGLGGGYTDDQGERNTFPQPQDTSLSGRSSQIDKHETYMGSGAAVRPVITNPDPPSMVLSTSFDPFTGDSLRAVPAGFTEWGVEEIRPSLLEPRDNPKRGKVDVENPFSLRVLVRTIFTRFGVDVKAVAAAAPGSECRVGAGGVCREQGGGGGQKILWAEWEKSDPTSKGQDGRSLVSKMDQTVFSLWQQVVSPTYHGEEGKRASFLFLDVRGVMGDENAVLPVFKYWVR